MVLQGPRWIDEQYASTTCPPTSGIAQYTPVPQSPHRSLDLPSPARATSRARPRERRDGSRRHSTRGSTDDGSSDGDPEPPSGDAGRQCPAAGCSNELTGRQESCSPRCRQRLSRARRAAEKKPAEVLKPGPAMLALMAVWQGKAHRHVPADPHDPTYNAVAAAWGSKRCYDETPDRVRDRDGFHRDGVHHDELIPPDACEHCGLKRHPKVPVCCLETWLAKRAPINRSSPATVLPFQRSPRSMADEQVAA